MAGREQLLVEGLLHQSKGLAFGGLATLVTHDVALVGEFRGVDAVQQITHPVALQPQREFQLVGRQGLVIGGAVEVGRAVDVARAGALQELDMGVAGHVAGALEHQVLKEVREARAAGGLLRGSDVVPDTDRDERQTMVFVQDHLEAVVEPEGRERNHDAVGVGVAGGVRGEGGAEQPYGDQAHQPRGDAAPGSATSGHGVLRGGSLAADCNAGGGFAGGREDRFSA